LTKKPKSYSGEKTASATKGVEKSDTHMWKNETRPLSLTLCKNQSKWIKDLDVRL
jgi:hypothetical protein